METDTGHGYDRDTDTRHGNLLKIRTWEHNNIKLEYIESCRNDKRKHTDTYINMSVHSKVRTFSNTKTFDCNIEA